MPERDNRRSPANVAASGGPITLKKARSKRQARPNPALAMAQEINPVHGFSRFLISHNVITVAVGFIIALQAQTLVKQLVSSFIDPLFILLFGQSLTTRAFSITFHGRTQPFTWGAFVYTFFSFLFILFVIFVIVKLLKFDKYDDPEKYKKITKKTPSILT